MECFKELSGKNEAHFLTFRPKMKSEITV